MQLEALGYQYVARWCLGAAERRTPRRNGVEMLRRFNATPLEIKPKPNIFFKAIFARNAIHAMVFNLYKWPADPIQAV